MKNNRHNLKSREARAHQVALRDLRTASTEAAYWTALRAEAKARKARRSSSR